MAKQSALGKAFVAKKGYLVVWSGSITQTSTVLCRSGPQSYSTGCHFVSAGYLDTKFARHSQDMKQCRGVSGCCSCLRFGQAIFSVDLPKYALFVSGLHVVIVPD